MQRAHKFLTSHPYWFALIAGGLSAFGFQPWGLWPLTLICFVLLIWLTAESSNKKQAFLTGWLFGVGHFTISLQWIAISFTYQAAMPPWLGYASVLLISLYFAIFPALSALGAWSVRKVSKGGDATLSLIFSFAGFWIIAEWVRSWLFTGFAWNPLAIIATDIALPSRIIGSYGVSGLIIILCGGFAALIARERKAAAFSLIPTISIAILSWTFIYTTSETVSDQTGQRVTIVQPGITQEDRYDPLMQSTNVGKLIKHSGRASGPRLLLWSESALPYYLESGYPFRYYQDQPGESAVGTRLTMSQLLGPDDILITGNDRLVIDEDQQLSAAHNSVAAMNAKGEILGWYDKAHLVPFGEYLALRWLLEPLGAARLVPGNIDFLPGPGPRTLKLGRGKPNIGMQICYEIIFSGQVVDRENRPDFIYNPSNDAWYGDLGPPQFLAQTRLRAIEEGLPVVRSTPTGISAVIAPNGRITKSLPLHKAGRIDVRLPRPGEPTLFARYGNTLPVTFALLLIAFALFPVARKRLHG